MKNPTCPEPGCEFVLYVEDREWRCPNGDHLIGGEFCIDCGDVADDEGYYCARCHYERAVDHAENAWGDR